MAKPKLKIIFPVTLFILSWLSAFFLGKRTFFRYLPIASFTSLIISVLSVVSNQRKWWENNNPLSPGPVDYTYKIGPFFLATIWIFKFTYGTFKKYVWLNALLNIINAYALAEVWERLGLFKLKKINHTIWYFICVHLSIIIYGVQFLMEKAIRNSGK
ncbi:hypothetical protein GLW03_17415 [Halobacillus halophilus]|uniref:hypothetical protein n=1 Tax=Halobacillus halophilus TaxID=1570 RepID=UPI00136F730F|nr:hypothetical protein [Halobacillus halophilus]MYL31601.1 hypothetical protein [Halobacillus halophilus]